MSSKSSKSQSAHAKTSDVRKIIAGHNVVVFSKSTCQYSKHAKDDLADAHIKFHAVELDRVAGGMSMKHALDEMTGQSTLPNIFIRGRHIGGSSDLASLFDSQKIWDLVTDKFADH